MNIFEGNHIIDRFNQRDEMAFTALYKIYFPVVYSFAKKFVDPEVASDVTSAVFIDLWKGKTVLQNRTHLANLLRIMTRNKCVDSLREFKKEQYHLDQLSYLSEAREEILFSEQFLEAGVYRSILKEVEKLPPHMRQVFKLSFIEGLKNKVIAERLHFKDASVRVLKAQALKILRSALVRTEHASVLILLISELLAGFLK